MYEKAGAGPKDEDRFKLARDTQNPVAFDKRRNLGTYRTTTNMAFQAPQDVSALYCLCLVWTGQQIRGQAPQALGSRLQPAQLGAVSLGAPQLTAAKRGLSQSCSAILHSLSCTMSCTIPGVCLSMTLP